MLVGDKKDIFLNSSHVGIVADKFMVFESGIEGIAIIFD